MTLPWSLPVLLDITGAHLAESNSYYHSPRMFRMHFVLLDLPQHLPGRYSGICTIPGTDLWCCHSSATVSQFEKWCQILNVKPVVSYNLPPELLQTKADRSIKIPADSPLKHALEHCLPGNKKVSKRIAVPMTAELLTNYMNSTGERRVTALARHFGCSTTNIIHWLGKLGLRDPNRVSRPRRNVTLDLSA